MRVASLANYLVLLKNPEVLKQTFLKFAITANLKINNFLSASKLEPKITGKNHTTYNETCAEC